MNSYLAYNINLAVTNPKYSVFLLKWFIVHACCVICRQGHGITLLGKSAYIFGGSSGSGYGEHEITSADPIYLNDLFHLKGVYYQSINSGYLIKGIVIADYNIIA